MTKIIKITINENAISTILWAAIADKDAEKVEITKARKQQAIIELLDALAAAGGKI